VRCASAGADDFECAAAIARVGGDAVVARLPSGDETQCESGFSAAPHRDAVALGDEARAVVDFARVALRVARGEDPVRVLLVDARAVRALGDQPRLAALAFVRELVQERRDVALVWMRVVGVEGDDVPLQGAIENRATVVVPLNPTVYESWAALSARAPLPPGAVLVVFFFSSRALQLGRARARKLPRRMSEIATGETATGAGTQRPSRSFSRYGARRSARSGRCVASRESAIGRGANRAAIRGYRDSSAEAHASRIHNSFRQVPPTFDDDKQLPVRAQPG